MSTVPGCPRFSHVEIDQLFAKKFTRAETTDVVCLLHSETAAIALKVADQVNGLLPFLFMAAQEGKLSLTISPINLEFGWKLDFTNENASKSRNRGMAKIFHAFFGIKTEFGKTDFLPFAACSWSSTNPILNPKPLFALPAKDCPSTQNARTDYFATLRRTGEFADVTFRFGEELVKAHKNILCQCPFFHEMLKENLSSESLQFPQCSSGTFNVLLDYLYTGLTPPSEKCVELYQVADYLHHTSLMNVAKVHMFEEICPANFIKMALAQTQTQDRELQELCLWFVRAHPQLDQEIDFKGFTSLDALQAYQIGKAFGSAALEKRAHALFKEQLTLDETFKALCSNIVSQRDSKLRDLFSETLEEKGLMKLLKVEKEQKSEIWKAYKKVTNSLDWKKD